MEHLFHCPPERKPRYYPQLPNAPTDRGYQSPSDLSIPSTVVAKALALGFRSVRNWQQNAQPAERGCALHSATFKRKTVFRPPPFAESPHSFPMSEPQLVKSPDHGISPSPEPPAFPALSWHNQIDRPHYNCLVPISTTGDIDIEAKILRQFPERTHRPKMSFNRMYRSVTVSTQ